MGSKSKPRTEQFVCEYCRKKWPTKLQLDRHTKSHLPRTDYNCTLCTYSTNFKYVLIRHISTHTKERPFKCNWPNCNADFSLKDGLRSHQLVHENEDGRQKNLNRGEGIFKKFSCPLCPFRSKHKKSVKTHQIDVHSTEKPFRCPQPNCKYACKVKAILARHMKMHADDRPWVCSFPNCGFRTKWKSSLKSHEMLHRGDKPFKCTLCPYACNTGCGLMVHIRGHTGETPYPCPRCPFRAKTSSQLTYHSKAHKMTCRGEKPYKCDLCPYTSTTSGRLTRHIQSHTRETPDSCPNCPFRGNSADNLAKHMKRPFCKMRSKKIASDSASTKEDQNGVINSCFECKVEGCGFLTKEHSELAMHYNGVHSLPKVDLTKMNAGWTV